MAYKKMMMMKKNVEQRNMRSIISPSRLHFALYATLLEALNNTVLTHVFLVHDYYLNGDVMDLGYGMLHACDTMVSLTLFLSISWA